MGLVRTKERKSMIEIIDFSDYEQQFARTYGGASGRKYDIKYENENWFLKFPVNIKDQVTDISYSNSSVSEYLGSHVYQLLGIETHETKLGVFQNKCVVACKDFIREDEYPVTGFGEFKTTFVPVFRDSNGDETNGNGTDLEEILKTLDNHPVLHRFPELKKRFWDMFVVDALIGNNDRNNGNWGLIKNRGGSYRVSPIFDNGSSFLPKSSEQKLERILKDEAMLKNMIYSGYSCIFELKGHRINPIKYMENTENMDCKKAILRIVPRIHEHLDDFKKLIYDIPNQFKGVPIISDTTKKTYTILLESRYEKFLEPLSRRIEKTIKKEQDRSKKIR